MSVTLTPVMARYAAVCQLAYGAADQKGKAAIRKVVTSRESRAMAACDSIAFQFRAISDSLVAAKPTKKAIDVNLVVARRVVALRWAATELLDGTSVPAGIESDSIDFARVAELVASITGDSEEDNQVASAARVLARAKITKSSDRRSIAAVCERAIDRQDDGTFITVADVAKMGALDGYNPSDGAVAAHLFRKDGSLRIGNGYVATEATADNPRGLTVAVDSESDDDSE